MTTWLPETEYGEPENLALFFFHIRKKKQSYVEENKKEEGR